MRRIGVVFFIFASMALAKPTHLEQLKSRYPYGLIGDDHGILTQEDLAVNTCAAEKLTPFSGEKNMAYSYWQCFTVKNAKISCSSMGYDPTVKMETGYFDIVVSNDNGPQYYLARDAMNIKNCKRYLRDWNQKTQGERYVCLSGSYGDFDDTRNGKRETGWVLEKFKTRRGCISSGSDCYLGHHPNKNCLLPNGWIITRSPRKATRF